MNSENPLNSIIGYSEILIENLGESEGQKCKDLQTIREAGHRLLELIDDLLDLSKLEAGKMTLHSDRIDFRVLFDGIAAKWRSSIVGSNEFVIEPPADRKILIDVSKLRRVIEDLLSNAVKFTKNGRITFSASTQGDTLTISVEDNGAGISERQIGRLFETFDRSENETASNYGDDVRLGLPLAYRYCRLMGGELSIQSKLGAGSRFTIQLPIQPLVETKQSVPELELLTEAA